MKPYYKDEWVTIYHGDCREILPSLEKVDLVLTDPPYGVTTCTWDKMVPLELMWKQLLAVGGGIAYIFFASQPFTSKLIMSNLDMFKYEWIWEKTKASNFQLAKHNPMKIHESVLVFYDTKPTYNQMNLELGEYKNSRDSISGMTNLAYRSKSYISTGKNYNKSIIKVGSEHNPPHPTQKPVELIKYLLGVYTNNGDLILDPFLGSGTTTYCAKKLNRHCIGIEIEEKYCEIAAKRCSQGVFNLGEINGRISK